MIISAGVEDVSGAYDDYRRYKFFTPLDSETGKPTEHAIFGLEKPLAKLINSLKSAAKEASAERRPFSSTACRKRKSTIAALMKRGLEEYSRLEPLYSFSWINMEKQKFAGEELRDMQCEVREDPLKLVMSEDMPNMLKAINDSNFRNQGSPMMYRVKTRDSFARSAALILSI